MLDTLSVPGGYGNGYNLDGEGRVYSTGNGNLASTTYNTAGEPLQINFGSGDSDTYSYDLNSGRMTQYKFNVSTQSVIGNLTWNANGSLGSLAITDPFNSANSQNCTYTHDDLGRLSNASCSGSGFSGTYSYDAFGNLNKGGTDIFDATYNSATNQMSTIGSQTPSYDTNGEVLKDFLNNYSWDAYGRPVSINGVAVTYDAFGRMVERNDGGSYSQVLYAPTGAKIAVMSGQSLDFALVPLAGGAVAEYHGGGTFYYRHPDWLGSSRFVSTTTQTMYSDGAYGPFGEPYAGSGTSDLMWTGMDQDTTPNVYDFPAREYGIQGRWPSPDPAGLAAVDPMDPQTWNRYAYVRNSPLSLVDPMGLDSDPPCQEGVTIAGQPCSVTVNGGDGGGSSSSWLWYTLFMNSISGWSDPYLIVSGPRGGGGSSTATSSASATSTSTNRPQAPTRSILSCAFSGSVLKTSAETGLDVFGAIPLAGNVAHGLQLAAGFVSAGFSLSGSFTDAAVSGGSLGLSIADTEKLTSNIALHGTELVPVFGNFVSGVSAVNDVFGKEGVVSSFKACRNGTN